MILTEIQEKWLQALESGNYKQGKHLLRSSNDEYCCLGVACELLNYNREKQETCYSYNGRSEVLPSMKELGLYSLSGNFHIPVNYDNIPYYNLAALNDAGLSFKDIASMIRSNPENVFAPEST